MRGSLKRCFVVAPTVVCMGLGLVSSFDTRPAREPASELLDGVGNRRGPLRPGEGPTLSRGISGPGMSVGMVDCPPPRSPKPAARRRSWDRQFLAGLDAVVSGDPISFQLVEGEFASGKLADL